MTIDRPLRLDWGKAVNTCEFDVQRLKHAAILACGGMELTGVSVYTPGMMLTPDQWNTLLETPAIPTPERVAGIASREEQKRADAALWTAIYEGDLNALRRALAEGARITHRRKGKPSLWEAVHLGQWVLVPCLIQAGADLHCKTLSHYSLMGAIAHRDDTQEAQRLLDIGFDDNQSSAIDFFHGKGAPGLLEFWLERGHPEAFQAKFIKPMDWLRIGAKGSPRLRALINDAWGIDTHDPNQFAKFFDRSDPLERFWGEILQKNDVELVRSLLKSGWGLYEDKPQYDCKPSWLAAKKGAWDVVDWLCTSDAFRQKMMEDARTHPSSSWWHAANTVAGIERIVLMGVDIEGRDDWNRNLGHHLLKGSRGGEFKKHTVGWLMTHCPQLLSSADNSGKTPMDLIAAEDLAKISVMVIKRGTKTPKTEPAAASVRRI
jgi:hypothetical protein